MEREPISEQRSAESQVRGVGWLRIGLGVAELAALTGAMRASRERRRQLLVASAAIAGVAALDVLINQHFRGSNGAYSRLSDRRATRLASGRPRSAVRVVEAITINEPIERVEERWATLESMPESLLHLSRLEGDGDARAIVEFRQAPGRRGTEVRVAVEYTPRSTAAKAMAKLFGGDPAGQIRQDLRRFKQIVETGEVLLAEGPSMWRAGQPAADPREIAKAAGLGVES